MVESAYAAAGPTNSRGNRAVTPSSTRQSLKDWTAFLFIARQAFIEFTISINVRTVEICETFIQTLFARVHGIVIPNTGALAAEANGFKTVDVRVFTARNTHDATLPHRIRQIRLHCVNFQIL